PSCRCFTAASIVVPVVPSALPLIFAPPPADDVDGEDDHDQRGNEDQVGHGRDSDGVTGAGIEPAARALKVRCSTTELPGPFRKVVGLELYCTLQEPPVLSRYTGSA